MAPGADPASAPGQIDRQAWKPHGQALFRRCIKVGNITDAGERHVKRTRNWRGSQRQHIHFGAKFFKVFLVSYTEALFFINDHQTQIFEYNVR